MSIDNEKVEIRDAAHLWNKSVWETQKLIKQEWKDPRVQAAVIGPAGENLVRYATIMTSVADTIGRTGMGAVMGSKKLKAIAVRGTKGLKVAHPKEFRKIALEAHKVILTDADYQYFSHYGTEGMADVYHSLALCAAHNAARTYMEPEPDYTGYGNALRKVDEFTVKHSACFGCPAGCRHFYRVKEGPYAGTCGDGPHFSGIYAIGTTCDLYSYPALLRICADLNQWGLDMISLGTVIGAAMEWYEKGIITKEDTDGVELNFSNHEAVLEMARKITFREGFGDILAEGGVSAAQRIGKGAEHYVQHSKRLEEAMSNYRVRVGVSLSRALSTRGADHLRGEGYSASDVPRILSSVGASPSMTPYEYEHIPTIWQQNFNTMQDCLNNCAFMHRFFLAEGLQLDHFAAALSAATGLDFSGDDLMKVGERIYNVEQAFNCREGVTREDDVMLPKRFYEEPTPDGPLKGEVLNWDKFEKMKDRYYALRGWDAATGIPRREKLEELGLKYIADELEGIKDKSEK